MSVMSIVCSNCNYPLGEHYCEHGGDPCYVCNNSTTSKINSHSCPGVDENKETFRPNKRGQFGFFTDPSLKKTPGVVAKIEKDISDWRQWAHNVPGECACGIPTHICTYHK